MAAIGNRLEAPVVASTSSGAAVASGVLLMASAAIACASTVIVAVGGAKVAVGSSVAVSVGGVVGDAAPVVGEAVAVGDDVAVGVTVQVGSGVGFQVGPGVGETEAPLDNLIGGETAIGTMAMYPLTSTTSSAIQPRSPVLSSISHQAASAARPTIGRTSR